jgi:hypothetical protein
MIVFVALIPLVLLVTAVVAWGLRRVVMDEAARESRLRARAETVRYVVPHGVDHADLRAAVARAGFSSTVGTSGTSACLLIDCPESERTRLRHVLEHLHEPGWDGSELTPEHVVFEDER